MDLILVMKERLRDQSSETRRIVRLFIYLACGGIALVLLAFYSHPSQTWTKSKADDGGGTSSSEVVSAAALPSGPSAVSFMLFAAGHVLLIVAARSVAELPRLSRGHLGWPNRPDPVSPQRVVVAPPPSPYVPKYGVEVTSLVMAIIFAEKFLSLSWILILQLCHFVLFGHVAYRSIAGIA
ncbi:transmembrane protein, putative [Bodo saltans]|uniref:Transmembrane protein, putative n=1 Tax=Bodo saltans TaxID=75058 RepID=A0A0S4IHD4_BODSA|nr:transmembrane protein, putative [Bodo saltans]|eukprot:CUE63297.1 transmembrane protein, putative [Bodo saltans]